MTQQSSGQLLKYLFNERTHVTVNNQVTSMTNLFYSCWTAYENNTKCYYLSVKSTCASALPRADLGLMFNAESVSHNKQPTAKALTVQHYCFQVLCLLTISCHNPACSCHAFAWTHVHTNIKNCSYVVTSCSWPKLDKTVTEKRIL